MKLLQKQDYLSRENTNSLKGILAICVLICHVWPLAFQDFHFGAFGKGLTVIVSSLGYLSVALFFFLSGYGLMIQYQKKGRDYLNGFLVKRVLPLYLISVILILFYCCVRIFFGEPVSAMEVIQSFFFGGTVISKGWYLQSILLWYLLFFISFRCFSKERWQMIALFASFLLYIVLCLVMQLPSTWYEGNFCLILGVLWAKYQEKMDFYLNSGKYFWILFSVWLSFAATFLLGNLGILPTVPKILFKCLSAVLFTLSIILTLKILPINIIVTKFFGGMYLEIYVIHGFALMLWHSKYIYLTNAWLYFAAVFVSTFLLAWALKPAFQKILQLGKRKKI